MKPKKFNKKSFVRWLKRRYREFDPHAGGQFNTQDNDEVQGWNAAIEMIQDYIEEKIDD